MFWNNVIYRKLILIVSLGLLSSSGFAGGDPAAGEKVFIKCKVCHEVTPDNSKIGPSLHGVIGRKAASLESFTNYSDALKASNLTWDKETLTEFLKSPMTYVKGTGMVFLGLKSEQEIENVLAYLEQVSASK